MKTFINLLKDQSGASAAEYALILAIVGAASMPDNVLETPAAMAIVVARVRVKNGFVKDAM